MLLHNTFFKRRQSQAVARDDEDGNFVTTAFTAYNIEDVAGTRKLRQHFLNWAKRRMPGRDGHLSALAMIRVALPLMLARSDIAVHAADDLVKPRIHLSPSTGAPLLIRLPTALVQYAHSPDEATQMRYYATMIHLMCEFEVRRYYLPEVLAEDDRADPSDAVNLRTDCTPFELCEREDTADDVPLEQLREWSRLQNRRISRRKARNAYECQIVAASDTAFANVCRVLGLSAAASEARFASYQAVRNWISNAVTSALQKTAVLAQHVCAHVLALVDKLARSKFLCTLLLCSKAVAEVLPREVALQIAHLAFPVLYASRQPSPITRPTFPPIVQLD